MDEWIKTILLLIAAKIEETGPIRLEERIVNRVTAADITRLRTDVDHMSGTVSISLDPRP